MIPVLDQEPRTVSFCLLSACMVFVDRLVLLLVIMCVYLLNNLLIMEVVRISTV
jgi:hypothetical protein